MAYGHGIAVRPTGKVIDICPWLPLINASDEDVRRALVWEWQPRTCNNCKGATLCPPWQFDRIINIAEPGSRQAANPTRANKNDHKKLPPTGFEPVTLCLEGRCSIQMSYGGISISG